MPSEELTPKEKATLYGMARFPGSNDRELSDILGENMSTVTSIRRRLRARGLYFRALVPSFEAMGCEVIAVCYGGVSSGDLLDMRKALDCGPFEDGEDASFFAQISTFSWLELGAFRDFTEAKMKGGGILRKLDGLLGDVPGHPSVQSYYPMAQTTVHNFFDHTAMLGKLFGIAARGVRPRPANRRPSRKLTSMERLVFYGLVKHPELPDKVVAERLAVSRQAVARIRRQLVDEGFLTPVIIPSLDRLGYELIAFFRFHLNPRDTVRVRESTVKALLKGIPNIFALSAGHECVLVGAYCTFRELEKGSVQMIGRLEDAGRFEAAPEVHTFLASDTVIVKNHDYGPIVKSMLELHLDD